MSDDDLIRRGDVASVVRQTLVDAAHRNAGKSGNWPSAFFKAEDYASVAIAAWLMVRRVREIEERKFYHDEWPLVKRLDARDLENGLLTDDGEAWRYRLTHSDARGKYDVLYRPTRKIAALAAIREGRK